MDTALQRFEQYLNRRFGLTSTAKHYLSDLHIFANFIEGKSPETITALDVDHFIDQQITNGLSPATINRRLSSLHTFFEYLASEQPEQAWPNPVNRRRHRLKMAHHLPRDVPDATVAQLFAAISDVRDQAMFALMVGAGLRVGEVADLQIAGLEFSSDTDQLTKIRVKGKGRKERMVWLPTPLQDDISAWLEVRPDVDHDYLFTNHHGRPLSVSGIQYRLKHWCQIAEVDLSCHRLRHTFARRLVEQGLPVDSLSRLLGHSQLQTTQRYIDGADPTLRADFYTALAHLETQFTQQPRPITTVATVPQPRPSSSSRTAPTVQLEQLQERLDGFPDWLREALALYLKHHWPTWRVQTANNLGRNFISVMSRIWRWMLANRDISGWDSFHRPDAEAWLQSRFEDGVSNTTIRNDLARLRGLLKFLETHDYPIDPGLFRIQPPQADEVLPRYLTEADYLRLETVVMAATQEDTYHAHFDRAWFLTLAHTGIRISELMDLRLGNLNLASGHATIRGSKPGRDRVIFLTPPLVDALTGFLEIRPGLPDNDRLFILRGRSPCPRTIQRRLTEYGRQAGVQVSPHRLRHTFATRLVNQGMPIHSLRKLLGHQQINTTQVYAQIYDSTLYRQFRDAISGLEAIPVEDWPSVEIMQPA